jgi:transcriptional/translational regulatory protein YebC/TACO1
MEVALEAGADDVRGQETEWEVITDPMTFEAVRKAIDQKGWKYLEARVGLIPQNTVRLEGGKAEQMMKLMDRLEDNDDVQNVYANFDISDEVMEKLSAS